MTFPLEQKGCHYYELAQYKIVTTAPYVNFCSLKDFFVSSSGFFVARAKISALLFLQIHNLGIDCLNPEQKNPDQVALENFLLFVFSDNPELLLE